MAGGGRTSQMKWGDIMKLAVSTAIPWLRNHRESVLTPISRSEIEMQFDNEHAEYKFEAKNKDLG